MKIGEHMFSYVSRRCLRSANHKWAAEGHFGEKQGGGGINAVTAFVFLPIFALRKARGANTKRDF